MSRNKTAIRINCPGGIILTSQLRKLSDLIDEKGTGLVIPGQRQDLLVPGARQEELDSFRLEMAPLEVEMCGESAIPNVMSSCAAAGLKNSTGWVNEGVYSEILDELNFSPKLKINLMDSRQNLFPLFTGQMNFIAAEHIDCWHLYLNSPEWAGPQRAPFLVPGQYIAETVRLTEKNNVFHDLHFERAIDLLQSELGSRLIPWHGPVDLPPYDYADYEDFHAQPDGIHHWLGISNGGGPFKSEFLRDLCLLAMEQNIGKVFVMPWRSFIIKEIASENINAWRMMLGRHKLNLRNASARRHWQIADLNPRIERLWADLIRGLEAAGTATDRLSFALASEPAPNEAAIVIEQTQCSSLIQRLTSQNLFTISHRQGFNRFSAQIIRDAEKVKPSGLAGKLAEVIEKFYKPSETAVNEIIKSGAAENSPTPSMYQCASCQTIYDERYGDQFAGILAGISFNELPEEWQCSLCNAPKLNFQPVH